MMAGPGDEIAAGAGGRGYLRASHADREQVIETLKAAFVQGRLGKGEFDLRVGQAFAARTYAELAAARAGLPAGLTTPNPPAPARARAGSQFCGPAAWPWRRPCCMQACGCTRSCSPRGAITMRMVS